MLITKLWSATNAETQQYRKASKALLVLIPLLGVTYVLVLTGPTEGQVANAFSYARAVLLSSQVMQPDQVFCYETKIAWWKRKFFPPLQNEWVYPRTVRNYYFIPFVPCPPYVLYGRNCCVHFIRSTIWWNNSGITFETFTQGLFVALFYCFLNTEVQNTVKHHIEQWTTARDLDTERRYYNNWSPRSRTESIRYSIPFVCNKSFLFLFSFSCSHRIFTRF